MMKDRREYSRKESHKKDKEEHRRRRKHRSESEEDDEWGRTRRRSDSSDDNRKRIEEEEDRGRRKKRRSSSAEGEGERRGRREGEPGRTKKRCRRHRRTSPGHHHATDKPEKRESEPRVREKSRWENGDESPDERRGKRGGSLLRAIKGEETAQTEWGKVDGEGRGPPPTENKAKPDFGLSGKLVQDTNTFNGVIIKYSEPADARKPKRRWRLYPFKGDVGLATMYVHRQSAYLIGRDRKVADLPVDHPSCSKQHAVLQYRAVPRPDGPGLRVAPYIIDLESSNGTYINNNKIDPKKFVELFEKDVIKFAYSSREYVLLHEHSKDDDSDDHLQD